VVVFDCLRDFIEVPLLRSNILSPSLEPDIVGTMTLSNSFHWHSRSDVEWSVDVETKLFVESFGSNWFSFIKVDNLPSLIGILVVVSILRINFNT
jgi:hypothetical protein